MTFTILNPGPFSDAINTPQVQNNPNITVRPVAPGTSVADVQADIDAGVYTETQNANSQAAFESLLSSIDEANQYTGTETETENFYPESSESRIRRTTLDGNEAEYPLAYVRFQEGAEYPVTLSNGITINIPLVATNTAPVAPTKPTKPTPLPTSTTVTYNQNKNGNISSVGSGSDRSITISAGNTWQGNLRPIIRNKGGRNLGGVISSFQKYIDDMDANASTNATNAENYATALGAYNADLQDYNIKFKIQQGVDAVAQAAAQAFYDKEASGTSGNYLDNREKLLTAVKAAGINDPRGLESAFKEFYISADLTPRKYSSFIDVPYGDFDSTYYGNTQDPTAKEKFEEKLNLEDDVDFLATYDALETQDPVNFYRFNYTQRVFAGENVRANEAEDIRKYGGEIIDPDGNVVGRFVQGEDIITEKDLQDVRDQQLGVTLTEEDELSAIKNNEYFKKQFNAAKSGNENDPDYVFWRNLQNDPLYSIEDATGGRIPIYEISDDKPNDFVSLFLKSQRDEDKLALNDIEGLSEDFGTTTELEDKINQLIGEEQLEQVSQFGQLTKDALKQTVAEIQNQKAREQSMAFYKGLGSFSEIFNAGKTISDSFLNDTGIGGILPMSSRGRSYAEKLEDKLEGATGINNSVEYNWENWFQDTLSKKYSPNYEENKEQYEPFETKQGILQAFTRFLDRNLGEDPYNQETNQFNEVFLERAGFNTTEELINYLTTDELSPEESAESAKILEIITSVSPNRNDIEEYKSYIEEVEDLIEDQEDKIDELDELLENNLKIDGIDKTVAGRFARDFVNDYLKPRFDTSRSMDEFIEYLDVRQKDKNPFQTEDLAFALRSAGKAQADQFLSDLQKQVNTPQQFDAEFYFDPLNEQFNTRVDENKRQLLAEQTEELQNLWKEASEEGFNTKVPEQNEETTWYQQAYRYGLGRIEDGNFVLTKDEFARLHYDLIGQHKKYDPAQDLLNRTIVTEKAQRIIDDYLKPKAKKIDSVFGRFITPEEFADEMLEGIDPYDDRYDEILESLGLEDFKGTIEDLRGYIIDIMRTGAAKEIRENIKFLNEQREDPDQEILGITYIDRPEDFKDEEPKGKTWLYESFQKSGYEGTEDEFYETFLPDVDRSEMELIGDVTSGKGLEFGFGLEESLSDPLAAYSNIAQLTKFGEEKEEDKPKTTSQKETSVFNVFDLGYEDDEDTYRKSPSAQEFLGEFAPFFK